MPIFLALQQANDPDAYDTIRSEPDFDDVLKAAERARTIAVNELLLVGLMVDSPEGGVCIAVVAPGGDIGITSPEVLPELLDPMSVLRHHVIRLLNSIPVTG